MLTPLRRPVVAASRAAARRYASSHHDSHHPPAEPESFGKGFYIGIATLVGTLAVIKFDQANAGEEGSFFTRMINRYHSREAVWEAKNSARLDMIAQAARDRSLFHDSPNTLTVDCRYPQQFDMGSPYNQEAGWATGNLEEIRDHFLRQRDNYVPKSLRPKQDKSE